MGFFRKKDYSVLSDKQLEAKFNTSKNVLLDSTTTEIDKDYLISHSKRYGDIKKEFCNR
jgi:hypothetical protein